MRAVIVIFVWKFPHFRYHGNRVGLTHISLTQKTFIWRKNLDDITYTSWVI